MTIDLRSDTVTKPTRPMLEAMFSAKVGDDVFGEDPTVIALEQKLAAMFVKEAGLFCPSGTMANQVAIKVHTQPGDEVICDELSHVYNYEGGGIAVNSGCSIKLMRGDRGRFSAEDAAKAINPPDVHFPATRLVTVENTCNKGGGSVWDKKELERISKLCRANNLKFHLDGARIFNAMIAQPFSSPKERRVPLLSQETGLLFDSISICLSKGLGAPAGSVLIGGKKFIERAKRVRKVFGGGMRQAGYLAAAGMYALGHHVERLEEDHSRARELEKALRDLPFVKNILPVETNIVIFELAENFIVEDFISVMAGKNIKIIRMGHQKARMVTHLDFTDEMLEKVIKEIKLTSA